MIRAILAQVAVGAVGSLAALLALVNAAKGKFWTAAAGLLVPVVGAAAALRLAKPGSLWARLYGPEKRSRSRARFGQ